MVWVKDFLGLLQDFRGFEQRSADIINLLVFLEFPGWIKDCRGMGQKSPCVISTESFAMIYNDTESFIKNTATDAVNHGIFSPNHGRNL